MHIDIVGLGPGPIQDITPRAQEKLLHADVLLLRTAQCETAAWLTERNIPFETLDPLYDTAEDFDALNLAAAEAVLSAAKASGQAVYAVPGSGGAEDLTVQALVRRCSEQGVEITCTPGLPLLSQVSVLAVEAGDPGRAQSADGLVWLMATDVERMPVSARFPLVIGEVATRILASEVKLSLLRIYPADHPVIWVRKKSEYFAQTLALVDIDRQPGTCYDHTACLYIPVPDAPAKRDIQALAGIVQRLRAPGGCPWDREQTHASIQQNLIEEAYEAVEAIELDDMDKLCDELGDVLLQVVFHAVIASQRGDFDLLDVSDGICQKLIRRHPHVFGEVHVSGTEQVLANWDQIKRGEKGQERFTQTLQDVPRHYPALMRCQKVQKRAGHAGMDFTDAQQALLKLDEEIQEVREVLDRDGQLLGMELGDLLFAAVNVVRLCHHDAEQVLAKAVDKFIRRFASVEDAALKKGLSMETMTPDALDALWRAAKMQETLVPEGNPL